MWKKVRDICASRWSQGKEGGAGGGCGGSVEKRARAGDEEADDIDKNAGCGRQKNNSVKVFGVN